MTLDNDDIQAIASAVVRQMRQLESIRLDNQYEGSLPIAEQKKRQQERARQFKAEQRRAA